jgi:hypothetical protein
MSTLRRAGLLGVTGLALLAAACGSSSPRSAHATTTTTTTSPASTSTSAASTSTTAAGTTAPSQVATTSTTVSTSIENLTATATVKSDLVAAFVAFKNVPASAIAGTMAGTVYYALDPSTGTYWATAQFSIAPGATSQTVTSMQDGGTTGFFSKATGAGWVMLSAGLMPPCASKSPVPAAVLAVWGLAHQASCTP